MTNGTQYEAQIRAENSVGTQTTYSSVVATLDPHPKFPDQVQFVGLINTGTGVDADWGAPENNGGTITGYRIEWDDNSGFSSPASATTTNTERTITGLSEGTTYYFRVRATNSVGNGSYSPTNSLSRDDLVNAPDAPSGVSGDTEPGYAIVWVWNIPEDNGARITGFDLQWRVQGANWSGNIETAPQNYFVLDSLASGTTYEARTRARNSAGTSGWSTTPGSAQAGGAELNRVGTSLAATYDPPRQTNNTTPDYGTALTVNITPTSSSAQIELRSFVSGFDTVDAMRASSYWARIRRGNTVVWETSSAISSADAGLSGLAAGAQGEPLQVRALDSPTSTSQQSYTLEFSKALAEDRISAGTYMVAEEL